MNENNNSPYDNTLPSRPADQPAVPAPPMPAPAPTQTQAPTAQFPVPTPSAINPMPSYTGYRAPQAQPTQQIPPAQPTQPPYQGSYSAQIQTQPTAYAPAPPNAMPPMNGPYPNRPNGQYPNSQYPQNNRTPWYKQWWVWLIAGISIAVIVIITVLCVTHGEKTVTVEGVKSAPSASQSQKPDTNKDTGKSTDENVPDGCTLQPDGEYLCDIPGAQTGGDLWDEYEFDDYNSTSGTGNGAASDKELYNMLETTYSDEKMKAVLSKVVETNNPKFFADYMQPLYKAVGVNNNSELKQLSSIDTQYGQIIIDSQNDTTDEQNAAHKKQILDLQDQRNEIVGKYNSDFLGY